MSGEEAWRQPLSGGRFGEAHRAYVIGDGGEPELERALRALADIEADVRERALLRARRRLERLQARPAGLVDWQRLEVELEVLERSAQALERSDGGEALRLLEQVETQGLRAEAANQRGTAKVQEGEWSGAREAFAMAVELDPRHYRALTNLGNVALEAGQVDEAIACYQRALAVNDEFANAYHNLGVAYRRKGQISQSVRHLRRSQRLQQRAEGQRARDSLSGGAAGGARRLRWLLYAAAALGLLLVLRGAGLL